MNHEEYLEGLRAAAEWRYIMVCLSVANAKTIDYVLWNRATSKARLDAWLMWRYDIDDSMARTISNHADMPFRCGFGEVNWTGSWPAPALDKYPELTIDRVLRAVAEGWEK